MHPLGHTAQVCSAGVMAGEVTWILQPGETMSRDERRVLFGGAPYGGIEPSARTPNVFVYSDRVQGTLFGYDFDGWTEDDSVFLYTGEGTVGDQEMREGNRAILTAADDDRAIRLFVADGTVSGRKEKIQRYVGEFKVDADDPYFVEQGVDTDGALRAVFVFRLHPIGDVMVRAQDRSTTGVPPDEGVADELTIEEAAVAETEVVAPENHATTEYERQAMGPKNATRREGVLMAALISHLVGQKHEVCRHQVRSPHTSSRLLTDLFDLTTGELFEAKGVTTRESARMAVGQLLDYGRSVPHSAKTVVFPTEPSRAIIDYLIDVGIGCLYLSPEGFVRATS